MTYPTIACKVAFGDDPLVASPTYTDISSSLFGFDTTTGRQAELDQTQPGVLSLTLDNTDRLYDPLYTSGTHYGSLKPNRRVKVQATYGGTTYDVFCGFIDRWPQDYAGPSTAKIQVPATDGFKFLYRGEVTHPWVTAVEALSPRAWWRLDETSGPIMVDSSGNNYDGSYTSQDAADSKADSLLYGINGGGAAHFKGEEVYSQVGNGPRAAALSGTAMSIVAWAKTGGTEGAFDPYKQNQTYVVVSDGTLAASFDSGGVWGASSWRGQVNNIMDGKPHMIGSTRSGTTVAVLHNGGTIDITDQGLDPAGSITSPTPSNDPWIGWASTVSGLDATIDEVLLFDSALSTTNIADLYQAGAAPWDGDTTGERLGSILSAIGWPSGLRNIDTGKATISPLDLSDAPTALELCQLVETSEQGRFFIDHVSTTDSGGAMRFLSKQSILTDTASTTSQATFADDPADGALYERVGFVEDDRLIVNQFTVKWTGGEVTVNDSTSQASYGLQAKTVDTILKSKVRAQALAEWLLNRYKDPVLRVSSVTLKPTAHNGSEADTLWTQVLSRKIGDRITVERTPQGFGNTISQELLIDGISHSVSNGANDWTTTFALSQADTLGTWWVLGTSELDTSTIPA